MKKRTEPKWLVFLVGTAFGMMVATMTAFLVVVGVEPRAYAQVKNEFATVSDIPHEEVVEVELVVPEAAPIEPVGDVVGDAGWEDPDLGYLELDTWVQPHYEEATNYTEHNPGVQAGGDLRVDGVQYSDDGTRYTWYSENVLPGGGLDIPGRHVGDGGYVMDGDGNLCVASSDHEIGTVLDTPYGTAVVYDTGCASGTVDMYTSW